MGDADGTTSVPWPVIKDGRKEMTDDFAETTVATAETDKSVACEKLVNSEPLACNNATEISNSVGSTEDQSNGDISEETALIEYVEDEDKKRKKKSNAINNSTKKRKTRHEVVEDVNGVDEAEDETYVPQYDELSEEDIENPDPESESEEESKPKKNRVKKNPNFVPPHLSQDMALGYKILHTFIETPQFSIFQRPDQLNLEAEVDQVVCLNQMKKKFDDNLYNQLSDFVNDVRSMLSKIYESRNTIAIKKALRLEQLLEQRIAQLPNYLRPQCALALEPEESENSAQKTMNKGGSYVSLLYYRAEKMRQEREKEKKKVLAEERKQLKEEQDKDMLEWEINVLLKDHEEEIKCMWELPQIGHFIHLCSNILNIGEISQYEIERILLMPQCSSTLDLLITSLLSNSLARARLHQTVSMPYSIWLPQVRNRVYSWYRALQKQNKQKVFEEIGVEPMFWDIVGTERNPLDRYGLHELPFLHRVWILKTLCDVDFVRKKTVHDNIRAQTLEELACTPLGVDRHGNRYLHFSQFEDVVRIYRQSPDLDEGVKPADLVESSEGFETRDGHVTIEKVFKDIYDVTPAKEEAPKKRIPVKTKRRKKRKPKGEFVAPKAPVESPVRGLRQSPRLSRKVYFDSESESDESEGSDLDLATLKDRLNDSKTLYRPISDKTFISYNVFRLPRDKVPQKQPNQKKSTYIKVADRIKMENIKQEEKLGDDEDSKLEAEDSKDSKEQDDKDEIKEEKDETKEEKEDKDNFTVKNLENLKMIFRKSGDETDPVVTGDAEHHQTPAQFLPDRSKFYLVCDSVESLRQLISKFSSDDNDLEIVGSALRSNKKNKKCNESPSCEVQLIERLQQLLEDLEGWEADHTRTVKSYREKMYKEYTTFLERPTDFIHPNEKFWPNETETPSVNSVNSSSAAPAGETPVTSSIPISTSSSDVNSTAPLTDDIFVSLRPRTRTRTQRQNELPLDRLGAAELGIDEDFEEDAESPESDDNWEMPQSHKKKSSSGSGAGSGSAGDGSRYAGALRPSRSLGGSKKSRTPKKSSRPSNSNLTTGTANDADKSKRALFWSPRSTNPSEELSWEANRQKLIEQRAVVRGDVETDMSELENAITTRKLPTPLTRPRIPPVPVIPGNKKPYFSQAQLKALDVRNKQTKDTSDSQNKKMSVSSSLKSSQEVSDANDGVKSPTRPGIRPMSRPVPRLKATATAVTTSAAAPRPVALPAQKPLFPLGQDIFLTDGNNFIKIDAKLAREVLQDSKIVETRFRDQLNLAKGVQIVTKAPQKPVTSGLRFIRPQNMPHQAVSMQTQTQIKPAALQQGQSYMLLQHSSPGSPAGQVLQVVQAGGTIGHLVPVSSDNQLAFIRPAAVSNIIRLQPAVSTSGQPSQPTAEIQAITLESGQQQQIIQGGQNFILQTIGSAQPPNIIVQTSDSSQNVTNATVNCTVSSPNMRPTLLMQSQSPIQQQVQASVASTVSGSVRFIRPIQQTSQPASLQTSGIRLIRPGQAPLQLQQSPTAVRVIRSGQILQTIRPVSQSQSPVQAQTIVQRAQAYQVQPVSVQSVVGLRPAMTTTVPSQTRPLIVSNTQQPRPSTVPVSADSTIQTQTLVRPVMTTQLMNSVSGSDAAKTIMRDSGTVVVPMTFLQQSQQQARSLRMVTPGSTLGQLQVRNQQPNQSVNGPRLVTVVSPRGGVPLPRGTAPTTIYLQDGARLLPLTATSAGTLQVADTVRQVVARQPVPVIRQQTPVKKVVSVGNVVNQPPVIKLDEEDDVVEVPKSNIDKVDILHGQLSAKQTSEGLKYTVKTSSGLEHVLTDEEVEARRAANNGRMY